MPTELSSVRDIVIVLGGVDRVAGRTGFDEEHVRLWLRRGFFPIFTHRQIERGLLEQNYTAATWLFGPRTPEQKNFSRLREALQPNTF